EPALGREVQVPAAVRPDRTRFLALDVALEPGGVDGLDEEFLNGVDGHELFVPLLCDGPGAAGPGRDGWQSKGQRRGREPRAADRGNLPPVSPGLQNTFRRVAARRKHFAAG